MSGWEKIFPEKRVLTLILDPFEAEELLDQARAEGRRWGDRTIMGMPSIAFGDAPPAREEQLPVDPLSKADLAAWNRLGANRNCEPVEPPDNKIAILPVVRREPMPDKPSGPENRVPNTVQPTKPAAGEQKPQAATWSPFRSTTCQYPQNSVRRTVLDEAPPPQPSPPTEPARRFNKARSKWERRGEISATDRALIDEAIAQGRVTKCPDCKHSVEPGELLPGEGWKKGKKKGPKSL